MKGSPVKKLLAASCAALALVGGQARADNAPQSAPPVTGSASAEACHTYKSGNPATVDTLSGYVGAAAFVMVFNAASAPNDGAVTPVAWAYLSAAGNWSMAYGGAYFGSGVTVCASSTGPLTKTAYSTNTVFGGQVR